MFQHTKLEHKFIHHIPEQIEPGVIYISMDYATAAHSCCCGCGEQVVTPFAPTDWELTFDGETVSLWPSIGNWNFDCRSHYIIRNSRIVGAEPWESGSIERGRSRDRRRKEEFYGALNRANELHTPAKKVVGQDLGLWDRIKKKVRKSKRR
jgi:hypothetical protein